jgi:hypothetical protein
MAPAATRLLFCVSLISLSAVFLLNRILWFSVRGEERHPEQYVGQKDE